MTDPAFLFYSKDFLTDVADLTMAERGVFITLLCLQHQRGHLSPKIISVSVGRASADVMSKFCVDPDGNYYNERLDDVIQKRASFAESRRINGSKGGRPRNREKTTRFSEALQDGLPTDNLAGNGDGIGNVSADIINGNSAVGNKEKIEKGVQGEGEDKHDTAFASDGGDPEVDLERRRQRQITLLQQSMNGGTDIGN